MIDFQILMYLGIILLAAALIVGAVFALIIGAERLRNNLRSGHFLFWPGGLILGVIVGGLFSLSMHANLATGVVIIAVMTTIALIGGRINA